MIQVQRGKGNLVINQVVRLRMTRPKGKTVQTWNLKLNKKSNLTKEPGKSTYYVHKTQKNAVSEVIELVIKNEFNVEQIQSEVEGTQIAMEVNQKRENK